MLPNPRRGAGRDGRTRLFIDAKVMSQARVSGIGHTLRELVRTLQDDERVRARYSLTLLTPFDGARRMTSLGFRDVRAVPLPTRGFDRWPSLPALPPLDALCGRGLYVFPHYGNWPLRDSASMTFIHDVAFLRHPETVGGNLGMLVNNIGRWISRTQLVATVSGFSRQQIMAYLGVPKEHIAVIPWGVDTDVFQHRDANEVNAVRRRYGLPEHYVLFVGNIEPRKNLVRLVRAHARLPAALRDRHPLVIASGHRWNDGEVAHEMEAAAARGDQVITPASYVTDADLPAVISGATLLAQPSLYEGFGMAPLQAMACAVPVLVGANSAQPEVVGDAALQVDVHDEDGISLALQTLISDEERRRQLVSRGLQRVREFTWQRTATAMLEALDRLQP